MKREDLQDVFSFKIRGAFNKMRQIPQPQLANGVITSSAGNHAQGVALSALKLNCNATILMPITTPLVKVNAVRNLKANVILFGDNYDETYKEALRLSEEIIYVLFIHSMILSNSWPRDNRHRTRTTSKRTNQKQYMLLLEEEV